MLLAPGGVKEFAANLTQMTVQLAAVPGGIFAHRSGGENEFVAESAGIRPKRFGNWPS
jgi:hypothetical protein